MSIRLKIVLVILPVLIASVILVGVSSYFYASTGITRIAREFLDFKSEELRKYAEGQWQLLVDNDLTERPEMVRAAQLGVEGFARSIVRSSTERILGFDRNGNLVLATEAVDISDSEREAVVILIGSGSSELLNLTLGGVERVGKGFPFPQFNWYFLLTEEKETFYSDLVRITRQTAFVLIGAAFVSIILILLFSSTLIKPLRRVIGSMKSIIASNDLTERVAVEYNDETGELAHTFNIMIMELEKAYSQIKGFAFKAVLAQKKEARIRNIFQKYVPQELIDRFYQNPESMLVGENRVLSVLFSDIRSFTSISEKMSPDDLVTSLNHYFSVMVEIIMGRGGIIDKYIGDAIMAFFGAPVKHDDDAYQSALAGLEMTEAVKEFNRAQVKAGKPEFKIGVGINYGVVTVGNIGTDKKMDYTVIGDMVNLASRLEGLTKVYNQDILVSESIQYKIRDSIPWRLLDTVAVKGKAKGVKIYTLKKDLSGAEAKGWELHNQAMEFYYQKDFKRALDLFKETLAYLPKDFNAEMIMSRAEDLLKNPPPDSWTGIQIMDTK